MAAQMINGKLVAAELREDLKRKAAELVSRGIVPGLAVVLVGDDPASQVYVRNKAKSCEQTGIYSEVHRLSAETTEQELLSLITALNADEHIHGILVQMPLPKHIDEKTIIEAVAVEKDVDGFHPINTGNLLNGDRCFIPCTPAGIIELIKRSGTSIAGKHAVVIGRSNIVGKPLALLLLREHATVTICHSRTVNLEQITRQADILIAAVGIPKLILQHHVKPGAVVIDVGINRLEDGTLVGDVDYENVHPVAGAITPVPGGVGPMTITMLLKNTLEAAENSLNAR